MSIWIFVHQSTFFVLNCPKWIRICHFGDLELQSSLNVNKRHFVDLEPLSFPNVNERHFWRFGASINVFTLNFWNSNRICHFEYFSRNAKTWRRFLSVNQMQNLGPQCVFSEIRSLNHHQMTKRERSDIWSLKATLSVPKWQN